MTTFVPKKALLNPKFEGYRLKPLEQGDQVTRFPLKYQPTQATASGRTFLSFEEMRSRITHNHLAIEPESGKALYIDSDGNVCIVEFDVRERGGIVPTVHAIYQLPTPIETEQASSASGSEGRREYPSAAFLGPSCVFVADGLGSLYVLPIRDTAAGDNHRDPVGPVAIFTLRTEGATETAFRLHAVHRASPTQALVLLSARYFPSNPTSKKNTNAQFEVYSAKIDILSFRSPSAASQPRPFDVIWRRRGSDIPSFTSFVSNSWLILSGSTYTDPDAPPKDNPKRYEPTPDEIAPIPRIGENLDSNPNDGLKPYPYSWTQTGDSLTVAFPLPSTATKHDIKVIFTTQTLTIHVQPSVQPVSPDIPIPHYSAKLLWDTVNSSSCFWTWDSEGDKRYGLLTCHMDKAHEGTRWPQLFSAVKRRDGSVAEEDPEVPETLDPSELFQIRESLEKYTSALMTGEDASGLGLGRGVPSLAAGEMDDEADAAVGRASFVSWISASGEDIHFPNADVDKAAKANFDVEAEGDEIKVLSTPLPGSVTGSEASSLVLKRELDGLLYTLAKDDAGSVDEWTHCGTFPALAFVLASKRDARFTYHLPSSTSAKSDLILAFESGTLSSGPYGRGGNVYIYHAPPKPKDNWAKQSLLRVGDGPGGALMGVGCVYVRVGGERRRVIVCLTEGSLVLLNDL